MPPGQFPEKYEEGQLVFFVHDTDDEAVGLDFGIIISKEDPRIDSEMVSQEPCVFVEGSKDKNVSVIKDGNKIGFESDVIKPYASQQDMFRGMTRSARWEEVAELASGLGVGASYQSLLNAMARLIPLLKREDEEANVQKMEDILGIIILSHNKLLKKIERFKDDIKKEAVEAEQAAVLEQSKRTRKELEGLGLGRARAVLEAANAAAAQRATGEEEAGGMLGVAQAQGSSGSVGVGCAIAGCSSPAYLVQASNGMCTACNAKRTGHQPQGSSGGGYRNNRRRSSKMMRSKKRSKKMRSKKRSKKMRSKKMRSKKMRSKRISKKKKYKGIKYVQR